MAQNKGGKVIQMLSPENYIRTKARSLPVYECLVNSSWEDSKLAQISIARRHTNGNITACFYLVDLMCLGVKDTHFLFNVSPIQYQDQVESMNERLEISKTNYTLVHNLVHAGIEFAEDYGFSPHKDFTSTTQFMLEEDSDEIELMEIDCGMDGKPVYVRGPFDDENKVKRIIAKLEKTAGPGNYSIIDQEDEEDFDDYEEEDDFDDDDDMDLDDYFDDEDDPFKDMSFLQRKELFLKQSSTFESLTDQQLREYSLLTESLIEELCDGDLVDNYYEEFFDEIDSIDVDYEKIPDELLGTNGGTIALNDAIRDRFVQIFKLNFEDEKEAKKQFKAFKKEAPELPGTFLLESMIYQSEKPDEYYSFIKTLIEKYPNYQLLRVLYLIEKISKEKTAGQLEIYPLKLNALYPDRTSLHRIERYYALVLFVFFLGLQNDLNKLEAIEAAVIDLDLDIIEEEEITAMISILKTNNLISKLKES